MPIFLPDLIINKITDLSLDILKNMDIKGILLDVDSTLAEHGRQVPYNGVREWIDIMQNNGIKLMILSNNNPQRVKPFADMLGLKFAADGLKPLPFKAKKAAADMGINIKQAALAGDQVYTDILAGNLAGMKTILLQIPEIKESKFFQFKRAMEKPIRKAYFKKHGGSI